jgi:hypothetical protein
MSDGDDLDGEQFFELMQRYRHCPLTNFDGVVKAFEDVKAYVRARACQACSRAGRDWNPTGDARIKTEGGYALSAGPCRHCREFRVFRNGKLDDGEPLVCAKNAGAACELEPIVIKENT